MTDDLERSLSQALKDRAVVERASIQSVLDSVSLLPERRADGMGAGRLAAAAAVIVAIAVLGVSIGLSDRFAATPSLVPAPTSTASIAPAVSAAPPGPVTAVDDDGMFRLALTVTRPAMDTNALVDVQAMLTYLGPPRQVVVHTGIPLVGFTLQRDGDPILGDTELKPCVSYPLVAGEPVTYPSATDKFAGVTDPPLRLAPGTWHIRTTFDAFAGTSCVEGQDEHSLLAETTIEVTSGAAPSKTLAPSVSPTIPGKVTATDEDATFRLTLMVTRSSQASDTPIDVLGSLTYLGPKAAIDARSGDRLVYFHAQRDGDPEIGGPWHDPCFVFPMTKGEPVDYRISAEAPGFENLADPGLRLPPGIWHIRATAGPSIGSCGQDDHVLTAEVTIVVLDH